MREKIRRVILRPYVPPECPRFTLTLFDTGTYDSRGCTKLAYRFRGIGDRYGHGVTIFEGDDFAGSPLHADDSDECVRSLLSFLTLRPGDTDPEYFADYTEVQRDFADLFAEQLAIEVGYRFGGNDR